MKFRGLARLALFAIPVAAAAAPAAVAHTAVAVAPITINVTTTKDDNTADCMGSNLCSLRQAIKIATQDNNGDTVQLGAHTYVLTILADSQTNDFSENGDLEIGGNMTLQGMGPAQTVIQGVGASGSAWNDRIIEIRDQSSPTIANISGLTVTGGNDTTQFDEGNGGGIYNDQGQLTLTNVVVDGNHSDNNGGGVASDTVWSTNISNTTISNNNATGNGGGLWLGGSSPTTDETFSNMYITGNTAAGNNLGDAGGGGIYDDLTGATTTTFTNLMVIGNHATGMSGGGVYENSGINQGATINSVYKNITIANNNSAYAGGGFYAADTFTSLTNATITGNSVTGQTSNNNIGGGGIAAGIGGQVTVNNATINGNTSTTQGGGIAAVDSGDAIHLHNTILVKNKVNAAVNECFKNSGNVINSTGYNIVDDLTCALTPATDRQGPSFDPNLGVLRDNGGPSDGAPGATSPTLTEALPAGSIAIDTADPVAANNPLTDERGVARPQGSRSDVGAYEWIPPVFVAPVLPAAGHPAGGNLPAAPWAFLVVAMVAALGAVRLGVRTRS